MLKTKNIIKISIMLLVILSLTSCTNKEVKEPVNTPENEIVETAPTKNNEKINDDKEIIAKENSTETSVNKRECKNRKHEGTGDDVEEIQSERTETVIE